MVIKGEARLGIHPGNHPNSDKEKDKRDRFLDGLQEALTVDSVEVGMELHDLEGLKEELHPTRHTGFLWLSSSLVVRVVEDCYSAKSAWPLLSLPTRRSATRSLKVDYSMPKAMLLCSAVSFHEYACDSTGASMHVYDGFNALFSFNSKS